MRITKVWYSTITTVFGSTGSSENKRRYIKIVTFPITLENSNKMPSHPDVQVLDR